MLRIAFGTLFFLRLGGVLGRFARLLGPSWGVLGASWGVLGASWGRLGASRGRLGRVLGRLGSALGRLGGFLGRFWIAKTRIPSWTLFSDRCLLDFRPNLDSRKPKKH